MKKLVAQHLIQLLIIVTWPHPLIAAEMVQHGTYFVFGVSTDYAVASIESREMSGGVTNDRWCKIKPLSPTAFFFSRGSTSAIDTNTHATVFDARNIAQSVYDSRTSLDFRRMAAVWATRIESIYYTHSVEFGSAAVHNIMADGVFIGTNESGDIEFGAQTILYRAPVFSDFSQPIIFSPDLERLVLPPYASGYLDLLREFKAGEETARAKAVLDQLGTIPRGPDGVAKRYSAYVTAVRDWSADPALGGEVATIILERGKNWRWYRQPEFCPNQ